MNETQGLTVGLDHGGYTSTVASWASVLPDGGILGRVDPTRERAPMSFDPREILGRKGLRYLSPAAVMAGVAVVLALDGVTSTVPVAETGIVGVSQYGHLETVCRAAERFNAGAPGDVSPMELPNASMNIVTSSIALRHGITGVCLTIDSGRMCGEQALLWAHRLLRSGRCRRVIVVAAEVRSTAEEALRDGPSLLEGATALVLDRSAHIPPEEVVRADRQGTWWAPYTLGALAGPLDAVAAVAGVSTLVRAPGGGAL